MQARQSERNVPCASLSRNVASIAVSRTQCHRFVNTLHAASYIICLFSLNQRTEMPIPDKTRVMHSCSLDFAHHVNDAHYTAQEERANFHILTLKSELLRSADTGHLENSYIKPQLSLTNINRRAS